jgi:hypothetical protein
MLVRLPSDSPFPGVKEKEAGIWAIDFSEESPEKSEGHAFSSLPGETWIRRPCIRHS